jgi:hypothetical protein
MGAETKLVGLSLSAALGIPVRRIISWLLDIKEGDMRIGLNGFVRSNLLEAGRANF